MNVEKLSLRLEKVAKYVLDHSIVADIGSDHAYLPCYLAVNKRIRGAIAGEINEGPYQSAKKQVEESGLEHIITVRKGNGLAVISANEAEVITICGMGGQLIATILEEGKEKLEGVKRLILQPNVGSESVRKWLLKENWILVTEEILKEDGKIYEVLVADRTGVQPYSGNPTYELLLGPYLLKEKSDVFREKWLGEIAQWTNILKQMKKSGSLGVGLKIAELKEKIETVKELINYG